jgi:simple sugar transport system ATP-binding protein
MLYLPFLSGLLQCNESAGRRQQAWSGAALEIAVGGGSHLEGLAGSVEAEPREGQADFLLAAEGVTKTFGELTANDAIDLAVRPGEIHALLGENGAGKSTLVKILYGSLQPDAGVIRWRGRPVSIANPADARALGIGMVFQHFSLFEPLTVLENVALGLPKSAWNRDLAAELRRVSHAYGLPLEPESRVADLSVGVRQRIEIVRCLLQKPQLIIMDEPTSVLTPQESEQLFETLERLASEGCAILYISHRLEEVKRLCKAATILRHGKVVERCDPRQESAASLARMMVGAEVEAVQTDEEPLGPGAPCMTVEALSQPAPGPFATALSDISFELRGGEILGIAGIAGNGQDELFAALSGEQFCARGETILFDGKAVGRLDPRARRRLGAAFVPEERLGHGAVPEMKLSENLLLTRQGKADGLVNGGFLDLGAARRKEREIARRFDVRMAHADVEAKALSGGNLQKFIVGREIEREPAVLVVSQPTWGVDAGAAAAIRQALVDLARRGAAVLMISQDLDEILEISDRIAVISKGRLSPALARRDTNRERIGLLMGGMEG